MKKLLYKNGKYYLVDGFNELNAKTRMLKYKASKIDMPHKHFKKYIVIYGRSTCPYCIKMMEHVKNISKSLFVEIDVEPIELFSKSNLNKILSPEIGNHSTVPIVFIEGKFIGGLSDYENKK